jgi:hypothetical protein
LAEEFQFFIDTDRAVDALFDELVKFYTTGDFPFSITRQDRPGLIVLDRGSNWTIGGSWKKLRMTLTIKLRQKEDCAVAVLHYMISGTSGDLKEKARMEVEEFINLYL